MIDSTGQYIGRELEIFAHAQNWKRYWSRAIQPWVRGSVLEVGAGMGANTPFLLHPGVTSCLSLEPDAQLAEQLKQVAAQDTRCRAQVGTTQALDGQQFDSLVYIDVLEHIEDDHGEMERASALLRPAGTLVVLCPAYQYLYSPFDKAVGHFRRYNRAMMRACSPESCRLERLFYLDAVGVATSLVNRLFLHQPVPTKGQILLWDRRLIPLSRLLDPVIGRSFGKSVIGVWTKR
jgi:hypothetical protein